MLTPATTLAAALPAGLRLADAAEPTASTTRLVIAAVVGIVAIVALIVWAKLHPFLALVIGSGVLAVVAGTDLVDAFGSFTTGLGSTVGGVGVLIALGAIIGKLLIDSGGADQIVDTILARTPAQRVPWALAFIAFIVGIPLFFEVGVVLLIPVVMLVARRAKVSPILVGIPALAGLSALHGLVPPHPGPLLAIDALNADLGRTLGLGLLVAIPTVIVSGPVLAKILVRWVHLDPPTTVLGVPDTAPDEERRRPSFWVSIGVVLLPVLLMLVRAVLEITHTETTTVGSAFEFLGEPLVALLVTALVSLLAFGTGVGRTRAQLSDLVGASFLPIAGILLIVGAGGGFKQTLVDSGVGQVIADGITSAHLDPLLAGWLVAVLIRVATGSATVATITAAGIMAPIAAGLDPTHAALMVLVIGAGSVFLSHVNDAGFWLVKEYFGMTVGQTFKTWSLMETVLSVVAGGVVMLLGLVV
ncbi:gluconate:H+ symporter [Xylanimonas protaetiae]|uniref:Gluconate transporter n=1 Tax=Xylanimonas protaetiae TaxID=2509457 RepID=A0A4P6F8P8_9MICO|nr:gluconate:H+ symporter [Xylanimonas protaetiae]QAY69677.1 gluconate transporter [Xylanimonas protaetiae]